MHKQIRKKQYGTQEGRLEEPNSQQIIASGVFSSLWTRKATFENKTSTEDRVVRHRVVKLEVGVEIKIKTGCTKVGSKADNLKCRIGIRMMI